jgi:MFS family permease
VKPNRSSAVEPTRSSAVLWIIPAVYFVFVAAEFAAMTYLALKATAEGRSALSVGLLATSLWTGILLASARSHVAVARWGYGGVFVGATLLSTLAIATLPWHEHFAGWLAACFVLGFGGGFVWVAGESWLAEAAPPARRGLYVGLFETAVGLGLMAGPALVPLARALDWPTLWLSTVGMLAALVTSALLLRVAAPVVDPQDGAKGSSNAASPSWRAVAMPLIAVAALSGLMESGASALLPSISMRIGFSFEAAAFLGTVIGAGSALLQPPAGHLADRWGVRRTTLLAWVAVLVANTVLLVFARDPQTVLWTVGFALGGMGGAVYTMMIVELGHRLSGSNLVKAVAALVTAYSLGTALGPTAGGATFDAAGLTGLALLLLVLSSAGLAVTWRGLRPHPETARPPGPDKSSQ